MRHPPRLRERYIERDATGRHHPDPARGIEASLAERAMKITIEYCTV
jgi:hypothetical protein